MGSDVFSLGVLLYRLLTGAHPFLGTRTGKESTLAVARAVLDNEPERGPLLAAAVPADLQAVVFKALEKSPARRYGSVDALRADLVAFQQGRPVAAQPPRWTYKARRFVQRHQGALSLAGGAALLVLGFGVWALHSAQVAREQAALAERRLAAVRALANKVVHDYNGALEPIPGTLALRKTLVVDALAYLHATGLEATDNQPLMADVARGYEAVGDVQGRGTTAGNLGELAAARASFGQAVALRRQLCESGPAATVSPAGPAACTAYALALNRLGDNLFASGLFPAALAVFEQGRLVNAPWLDRLPVESPAHDAALAAHHLLVQKLAGLSSRQAGEAWAMGTVMAREQLALARALQPRHPGHEAQERIRLAHDFMAFRLAAEGDVVGALPHAEEALALARQPHAASAARFNAVNLALALVRLGELQVQLQQAELARPLLADAVAQARALHLGDPDNAHLRGRYANVARRAAAAFNLLGQPADLAVNQALLGEARAAAALFTPQDGPFYFQRQQLLLESARRAWLLAQPLAAQAFLTELPAEMPPGLRAAQDLADVFVLRAQTAVALRQPEAARAAFQAAETALSTARAATPADAANAQRLAEALHWALQQPAWQAEHARMRVDLSLLLQQMRERKQFTPLGARRLGLAA